MGFSTKFIKGVNDMKPIKKFDYEKFDYDSCYHEIVSEIKKPNILICGATGAGKSSLVNSIFQLKESEGATVGKNSRPETRGVKKYETQSGSVNLYDSEGYEIGGVGTEKADEYYKNVLAVINDMKNKYHGDMSEYIHEVWYCVSAASKRFHDVDKKIIKYVMGEKIPVMVLVTKIDQVDKEEMDALIDEIHSQVTSVNIYTYSANIKENQPGYEYVQNEEIIKWAMDNLDNSLQNGFIPAVKNDISSKRNLILKEYIPKYAGIAGATVLGTSFVPVPFSDSVPLMGIQVKMSMSIINVYGIDASMEKVAAGILGTGMISYIGKTLAAQLLSIVPVIGTGTKATVNVSVAATVTAVLGTAMTLLCEQYLKECVDNNGAENLPFAEFITTEKLKELIVYVKNNKSEFELDSIINSVIKKNSKN